MRGLCVGGEMVILFFGWFLKVQRRRDRRIAVISFKCSLIFVPHSPRFVSISAYDLEMIPKNNNQKFPFKSNNESERPR